MNEDVPGDDPFRLLFDLNPRPMLVFDRETLVLVAVNGAACALYGWSHDEMHAMTLRDIRPAEDVPELEFALARERQHAKVMFSRLSRHVTKGGRILDVNVEMSRLTFRGRPVILCVITDLTSSAEVERRSRVLVEHSADGSCLIDEHLVLTYLSPGAERILGVATGELVGRSAASIVHPDDLVHLTTPAPGESHVNVSRLRGAAGAWRWIEATTTNLVSDPGIRAYVTNFRDISDRKAAERTMLETQHRLENFRILIERLPIATLVHRLGSIIYVNPACAVLLGHERAEDLVGRMLLELIHPDDREPIRRRIALGYGQRSNQPAEIRMLRRDGTVLTVEGQSVMLDFDGEPATVVFGDDVSERRQLFARMAMADRLLSVGTLAAGVAHEINNPLAYVVSNLELLAREVPLLVSDQAISRSRFDRDAIATLLAEAREGAERVGAIVRDMRALSRPANDVTAQIDVIGVLTSTVRMAHNQLRHRARLFQSYDDGLPRVRANASRLGQVFLNLLVNAAQAIEAGHADVNEIRIRATTTADRCSVQIEIEDTGPGIPADIVGRIFDPFFTTKPVGVGIGLGLSISHQIVQAIGGEMSVASKVGQGTTFRITLPAAVAEPDEVSNEPVAFDFPSSRILMIDDEAAVGRAVHALLSPDHEVVSLTRARAALSRLEAGETFDVILCDLMMPEMSGMEFYDLLAPGDRERVVFVTGGAFTEQARQFLAQTNCTRIEKPFTEEQLRRAIHRVVADADVAR